MKALITASEQFGPFASITQLTDRWVCDGVEYQFDVIGDATIGEYVAPVVLPTVDEYKAAAQNLLDTTAQAHGYDDIVNACGYAAAPNPFELESKAFVTWRGNVWGTSYTIMAEVQAGTRPQPTLTEFLALLPVYAA